MLLFDIDGTLIYSGGAGTRSIDKSFKEVYGIENAMKDILPDGKTDPLIIKEVFIKKLNKNPEKQEIINILNLYLKNLEKEIYNPKYKVFEGAKEFLEWAEKTERFLLGLQTGNLEKGAKIKLKPSCLLRYFKFGGYASDSWERSGILKKAYERGLLIAKEENSRINEVFVIGDTPLDIIAARNIGFKSVGMALYNFSEEDLKRAGAEYVFKDYSKLKEFFSQYTSFSEG